MRHIIVFICVALALLVCCVGVAYGEPAGAYAYISNYNSNSVSVIDLSTFSRATDFVTDTHPSDIYVNSAGTYLYVAFDGSPYVNKYSTTDYSLVKRILVSANSSSWQYTRMCSNDQGTRLYVTMYGDSSLYVIDTTTDSLIDQEYYHNVTWDTGSAPYGVAYYNGYIYISMNYDETVIKVDVSSFETVKTYPMGAFNGPGDIAVDRVNGRLLVANNNATTTIISLSADDANGVLNFSRSGSGGVAGSVCVNASGYVYRSDYNNNNVTIFDTGTGLLTNITLDGKPWGIASNNYNSTVFVACQALNRVYIIDGASLLGYVQVGNGPYRVTMGTQADAIQHQVKFVVQSIFGIFKYENVTVTVYDDNGVLQYSQKTDSSGQVAFYLNPGAHYTIWANSTTDNINQTKTIVPYDDTYYFNVWSFFTAWNPFGWAQNAIDGWTGSGTGDVNRDIRMNYTVNRTASPRIITLNYSDATASTTLINFTLLRFWQENGTYTAYNITAVVGSGMSFQQMPITVPEEEADGESYQIVVTGTTGAYGTVKRMDTYHFPGVSYPLPGLPASWYPYVAFAIIIMFGLFFTYISGGLGLIVMAFWGTIFMFMGWLTWSDATLLLFQVLAVFGVGQIFKMRKQREGV